MKKEINVGDEFTVQMIPSKKAGKPIARIEGMVSIVNNNDDSKVVEGASYVVRVDEVKESCLIITPLIIFKTKEQNEEIMADKLKSISKQKRPRIKKPKNRAPEYIRNGK